MYERSLAKAFGAECYLRFKTSLARRSLGEGGRPPWLAVALAKVDACHADLSRQSPGVGGSLGEGGTPEPKRIAIGLITRKGKLSLATEKSFASARKTRSAPSVSLRK